MRIAMGIEYDGTAYNGWQRQRTGLGVQEVLEKALSQIADENIETSCAGRTDSGVHAMAQVVHFDTVAERSNRGWLLGSNSQLPDDINVSWVTPVNDGFHARYSAIRRRYRYLILNRLVRSSLFRNRAWWLHQPLDESRMAEAAGHLLGEHDFSAFRAAGCQARTAVREVTDLQVWRRADWLIIDISANGFLQHMVRNISGLLAEIGSGERDPDWARTVLRSRDRSSGGVAAPAHGLSLVGADYPAEFGVPTAPVPALFPGADGFS